MLTDSVERDLYALCGVEKDCSSGGAEDAARHRQADHIAHLLESFQDSILSLNLQIADMNEKLARVGATMHAVVSDLVDRGANGGIQTQEALNTRDIDAISKRLDRIENKADGVPD